MVSGPCLTRLATIAVNLLRFLRHDRAVTHACGRSFVYGGATLSRGPLSPTSPTILTVSPSFPSKFDVSPPMMRYCFGPGPPPLITKVLPTFERQPSTVRSSPSALGLLVALFCANTPAASRVITQIDKTVFISTSVNDVCFLQI